MVTKGNVSCKTIAYLTKAQMDIEHTVTIAKCKGITLSTEEPLYRIKTVLIELTSQNDIAETNIVIFNLLAAIVSVNNIIDTFAEIGISLDCDAFDGYLYNGLSALSTSIFELCGISITNEEECAKIDSVRLDNVDSLSRYLCSTYKSNIDSHLKYLFHNW